MWGDKENKEQRKRERIDEIIKWFVGRESCRKCGCLLGDPRKVNVNHWTEYYCGICKPPYDKHYTAGFMGVDTPDRYIKNEVLCDKNGKPL